MAVLIQTSWSRSDGRHIDRSLAGALALHQLADRYHDMGNRVSLKTQKEKALALARANRLHEARALFQGICRLRGSDAESWYMLGAINGQLGLYDEAIASLQKAISLRPSAEAYDNLANALQRQGEVDQAILNYRNALALRPDFSRAHLGLGDAYRAQCRVDAAVASYRRALERDPRCLEALCNLGSLFFLLNRHDEALAHYQEALRLNPNIAEVHNHIGLIFRKLGETENAEDSFREALRIKPDYSDALSNLGDALLTRQHFNQALECYRRVLREFPDHIELLVKVGDLLYYLGESKEAVQYFRQASLRAPRSGDIHRRLGDTLATQLEFDEASAAYRRALHLDPHDLQALAGLAHIAEKRGQLSTALEILRPLVATGRVNWAVAIRFAEVSGYAKCRREALSLIERLLNRTDTTPPERQQLLFRLGALYEDLSEYDNAFRAFTQANAEIQQDHQPANHTTFVNMLVSTFSSTFLAEAPRGTTRSDRPIFIVGMPRSGTSLVEQILASHPQIGAAGELDDIPKLTASLHASFGTGGACMQPVERLRRSNAYEMARDYLEHLQRLFPRATRVTDKMPQNFLHLGLIELLFPGARVIHCRRDPLDTCLSCYFQDFGARHPYSAKLAWLGSYYREYERLMSHWRCTLTLPMFEIRYEDLVADQEIWTRRLLKFCGLPWDERCLSFHKSGRIINTASYAQVRRPLYRSSVGRWRHYDLHLHELRAALAGDQARTPPRHPADPPGGGRGPAR